MSLSQDWFRYFVYKGFKGLVYLCISTCIFSCHDSIDVYNRPGFDAGTRPRGEGSAIQASPPVYAQPAYGQPSYPPQQQAAPGFRPAPDYYYYQPYYPQQQYQRPASRAYNNPYSFQPPVQYPYYDTDQYYTPPAAYNPSVEHEDMNSYRGQEQGPTGRGGLVGSAGNGVNPLMH